MIRIRNQEKFDKYFKDLWGYVKKLFPNNSRDGRDVNKVLLNRKSQYGGNGSVEFMEMTLRNIAPYIDKISQRDEFMFMPEFGNPKTKPLQFLPGFDFRRIWKLRDLTNENKKIIFRYLEFLYLQSSLALGRNKEKVNQIIEAIKMEQEIAKEAEENPDAFGDQDQGGQGGDFESLFGDDDTLMGLVNDLKDEFNLEETFGEIFGGMQLQPGQNPMAALQGMAGNPAMKDMMEKMAERVQSKMEEKNISQEDLMKSAENLKKNLAKNVSGMPGGKQIKKMIDNLDMERMAEQFQQQSGNPMMQDNNPLPGLSQQPDPNQLMQQLMGNLTAGGDQGQGEIPPELQQMLQQLGGMENHNHQDQSKDQSQ